MTTEESPLKAVAMIGESERTFDWVRSKPFGARFTVMMGRPNQSYQLRVTHTGTRWWYERRDSVYGKKKEWHPWRRVSDAQHTFFDCSEAMHNDLYSLVREGAVVLGVSTTARPRR